MSSALIIRRSRKGLTLIELVIVIAILAIVAGFIIPLGANYVASSKVTATNANLVLIRNAIMGTQDQPGFYNDTGRLPNTIAELFIQPTNVPAFNRDTGVGWRGPYIIASSGQYTVNTAKNFFQYVAGPLGLPGIGGGGYGMNLDPAILDAWGNPIVIQIPYQTTSPTSTTALAANLQFARLVSAGPDGIIETPQNPTTDSYGNPYPLTTARGDDIVLFINHSDSDP